MVDKLRTSRKWSIRAALFAIAAIITLPAIGFNVFLTQRYAESERGRAQSELEADAFGTANLVDAKFTLAENALLVLASSTLLDSGDLRTFEGMLRRVSARTGNSYVLVDPQGQQVINTALAGGASLPRTDTSRWQPVFTERRPYITDVTVGAASHQLVSIVVVPVIRDDTIKWTLSTGLYAKDFADILAAPGVPTNWVVSIVDRKGIHLVRMPNSETFAGRPLIPELVARLQINGGGTLPTTSLEGIPLISTVARAPKSGWAVAIGRPRAELEAPLRQHLRDLLIAGLFLLAVALIMAWLVGRQINRGVAIIDQQAQTLARGEPIVRQPFILRETGTIAEALIQASLQLQSRDAATRELNATLESQVAARTAALAEEMQQRQRSEEQLRQMQKIEAIGQLTGGIAHDFNNMLAVVLGSLRLLERRLGRGENPQEFINSAKAGAERAAELTRRLLAFGRRQALSPEPVDVNKLLAGMSDLLRRTIPESIAIETVLAGGLWRTHVDAHALENAVLNLVVNARDAMADGGKLTIETANAHLDDAYVALHAEVAAGQYVLIAVTDTGSGMPTDVAERAFEPFFTTKTAGDGSGLGLSQVHGFIKQSGGHVKLYSEAGQGVTVKLYLPRFFGPGLPAQSRPEVTLPRARHNELVLVVEDSVDVLNVTIGMLSELGYRTLAANGGAEAVQMLDADPDVSLLFTDIVMPDLDGRRLAQEALQRRPQLKVLFTTGYTRNAVVHNGVLDPGVELIMKPFSLEALAHKVDQLLRSELRPAGP